MELFREIPAASGQDEARWKFFKKKVIGKDTVRGPMLIRYIITQTPWFGLYAHNILREDADRDCHDHPWRFTTLVLRGGYIEELRSAPGVDMSQHMYRLVRSLHTMPTRYSHKIVSVEPNTWTLLVVGRKVRDWGVLGRSTPTSRLCSAARPLHPALGTLAGVHPRTHSRSDGLMMSSHEPRPGDRVYIPVRYVTKQPGGHQVAIEGVGVIFVPNDSLAIEATLVVQPQMRIGTQVFCDHGSPIPHSYMIPNHGGVFQCPGPR